MDAASGRDHGDETVTVRYWAGARAAAGTAEDTFVVTGELALSEVVALVLERHPDDQMARTVAVCSVLLGDQPVRSQDPASVLVRPGGGVGGGPPSGGGCGGGPPGSWCPAGPAPPGGQASIAAGSPASVRTSILRGLAFSATGTTRRSTPSR